MILFILAVASFVSEVRAFNWGAVTGNGGTTGVYVNNFDWDDQWGWCVSEDKRVDFGKVGGRKQCLDKCEQETWNGKYPRGCEYSGSYRTCTVFFGKSVRSSQKGSNYRCNINIARGVSFSSSKTETEAETEVGLQCGQGEYRECNRGGYCWCMTATEAETEVGLQCGQGEYRECNRGGYCWCMTATTSANANAQVQSTGYDTWAVYGFAVVGLAAVVGGVWKNVVSKQSYAQITPADEL